MTTDRRTQILDSAACLIASRGYATTSVEDVIERAGLSGKSHFYHYFKSKEELGFAVLDRQFERFAEHGLAILRDAVAPPLDRLERFIDSVVEMQANRGCREGCPFGSLAAELSDAHDGFRQRIAQIFERWTEQLEALLWELRPSMTAETDIRRVARFVVVTLEGAMLVSRCTRDVPAMQQVADDLKRFVRMHLDEARTTSTTGTTSGGKRVGARSTRRRPERTETR